MEMEPASTPEVGKKLWHIVRVILFMVRKGIAKSRIIADLHLMLKRGNKLAGKAIGNLLFHNYHHSSFSCRSNDALSFTSPREYEFSCSNTPANSFYPFSTHKRKHHHFAKSYKYNDVTTVASVQKMLEMLNNHEVNATVEASPLTLPGFGKSPMVRQLRITDSPFPLKDEGDSQVDKQAEEFIKKFYKDLKLQKTTASAFETPNHDMWGR
ncbi:unnamed protein product [Dovyalis caffra]|uniref:Avr9/Cf-9 rapidly elicited protein 146 n=1 Tax=Dovyalis caffra TaxID=77055 RepID=A0AAV1RPU9_9ROSI|nr:unnamed protein product [Dovyalis caffra]